MGILLFMVRNVHEFSSCKELLEFVISQGCISSYPRDGAVLQKNNYGYVYALDVHNLHNGLDYLLHEGGTADVFFQGKWLDGQKELQDALRRKDIIDVIIARDNYKCDWRTCRSHCEENALKVEMSRGYLGKGIGALIADQYDVIPEEKVKLIKTAEIVYRPSWKPFTSLRFKLDTGVLLLHGPTTDYPQVVSNALSKVGIHREHSYSLFEQRLQRLPESFNPLQFTWKLM